MALTETVLIGIACALSQGKLVDANKVVRNLNQEQKQAIQYLKENPVCEELEAYLKDSENKIDDNLLMVTCSSCLQTSKGIP